jgi:hypothetical protein
VGLNLDSRTKLEIIADDFVEDYLRNNPVMVFGHIFGGMDC